MNAKSLVHPFPQVSSNFLIRLAEKAAATFAAAFAGSCIAAGIGVQNEIHVSMLQRALQAGVGAVVTLVYGAATKYIGDPNEPAPVPTAPVASQLPVSPHRT